MTTRTSFSSAHALRMDRTHQRPTLKLLDVLTSLYRQRVSLGKLEPHMLDDIGITCDMARREAERPVWDVPQSWRR